MNIMNILPLLLFPLVLTIIRTLYTKGVFNKKYPLIYNFIHYGAAVIICASASFISGVSGLVKISLLISAVCLVILFAEILIRELYEASLITPPNTIFLK